MITKHACPAGAYSIVDFGDFTRIAFQVSPVGRGRFLEQAEEALAAIHSILQKQKKPQELCLLTVFLKNAKDQSACERLLASQFGDKTPVINLVHEPPCNGAALTIEGWTISDSKELKIERFGSKLLTVSYRDIKWVHCGGIVPDPKLKTVYDQSLDGLNQMRALLKKVGIRFDQVTRTWLYLGDIVGPEADTQRYKELNRARADIYKNISFGGHLLLDGVEKPIYPASTGIGMTGHGLVMSCLAIDTAHHKTFLFPLENPNQTPAFRYERCYSPKSPRFSRAMALALGHNVTIWISGTASVVNSLTVHLGDAGKQTEQTIDNIEALISQKNFARHNFPQAGATLKDLVEIRCYVKHQKDYEACRAVCEKRLGKTPIVFTNTDVCRDDLLVEIEGVAIAKLANHV